MCKIRPGIFSKWGSIVKISYLSLMAVDAIMISERGIVSPFLRSMLPDFSLRFHKRKGFQVAADKPCFLRRLDAPEYFGEDHACHSNLPGSQQLLQVIRNGRVFMKTSSLPWCVRGSIFKSYLLRHLPPFPIDYRF